MVLPPASAAPTPATVTARMFGYGVSTLSAPDRLDRAKRLGFNWVKLQASWRNVQPASPSQYDWTALDRDIDRASQRGLRILLRVDQPPAWASGSEVYNTPPINDADFATFMGAIAARYAGRVQAYEIWNEPNTSLEWGGRSPDPAKFARMLQALAPKVRQADPAAIIVTGGVATTGDGGPGDQAWGDRAYIEALYANGAKGSFDAIGSHPYAGPFAPEANKDATQAIGVYFRRAEEHRAIAEANGDSAAIWPTEVGWLYNQNAGTCRLEDYDPYHALWQLTAQAQGEYLMRAYSYAAANWPWTGPLFIYNLDFAIDSWRVDCDPNRFFSLVDRGGNPLPAFTTLASMPRYERDVPITSFRPFASVQASTEFLISFSGYDATSGISSHEVQYRVLPSSTWQSFRDYYVDGDVVTYFAENDILIEATDRQDLVFRIRPMDWAGNVGEWRESPPTAVSQSGYIQAVPSALTMFAPPAGLTTTLTIRNSGGSAANWTVASDSPWLTLSPTSGHLGSLQTAVVTVTVPAGLPPGTRTGTVALGTNGWRADGPVLITVVAAENVTRLTVPAVSVGSAGSVAPAATNRPIRRVRLAR